MNSITVNYERIGWIKNDMIAKEELKILGICLLVAIVIFFALRV